MSKKGYFFKHKETQETLEIMADYLYNEDSNKIILPEDLKASIKSSETLENDIESFDKNHFEDDAVKNTSNALNLNNLDPSYYITLEDYNNSVQNIDNKLTLANDKIVDFNSKIDDLIDKDSNLNTKMNSDELTVISINNTLNSLDDYNDNLTDRLDIYNDIIINSSINTTDLYYTLNTNVLNLSHFNNESFIAIINDIDSSLKTLDTRWSGIVSNINEALIRRNNIRDIAEDISNSLNNDLASLQNRRSNLQSLIDANTDINLRSLKVGSLSDAISNIYLDGSNLIVEGKIDTNTSNVDGIRIDNNRPKEIRLNSTKVLNVYYKDTSSNTNYLLYKYNFTVNWYNYNNVLLRSEDHTYNHIPSYPGTPVKPSDDTYNYTFSGWSPTPSPLTNNVNYYAQYTASYVNYPIYIGLEYRDGSTVIQLASDQIYNAHNGETVYSSVIYNDDVYETEDYVYYNRVIESVGAGPNSSNRIATYYTNRSSKLPSYAEITYPYHNYSDSISVPTTIYYGYSGTLNSNVLDRLYSNFNSHKDKVEVYINGTWYKMNNLPSYWSVITSFMEIDGYNYFGITLKLDSSYYDEEDYSYGSDMTWFIGLRSDYSDALIRFTNNKMDYPDYTYLTDFRIRIVNN